jgi:hypothetical protein
MFEVKESSALALARLSLEGQPGNGEEYRAGSLKQDAGAAGTYLLI